MRRALGGVIPPLVTPLTDDAQIDEHSLCRLIDHVIDGGASGIFVLGSTGEGTSLTDNERTRVISIAADQLAGRGDLLVGVLAPGTRQVAELIRIAINCGATGVVATPPFYVGTHPAEITAHFRALRDACADTPLLAYNIPQRTHSTMDSETLIGLARDGVIAGVKDSSGELPGLRNLILARDNGEVAISVLTGAETTTDLATAIGVDGIIPGLGNIDPQPFTAILAYARTDINAALQYQRSVMNLYGILSIPDRSRMSDSSASIGAVKGALHLMGVIDSPAVAPPLTTLDADDMDRIRKRLAVSAASRVTR